MNVQKVPVDKIKIPEIRASSQLTEEQKILLESSIKQFGIVQPIIVRKLSENEYELIAGKNRLESAIKSGLKEIDAIVLEMDTKMSLMLHLLENMARGKSNPVDEAKVLKKFIEEGGTIEEIAKITGHSKEWVKLRLLIADLPEEIQNAIKEEKLTLKHITIAGELPTPEEMYHALKLAIDLDWDTRTLENYVTMRKYELEKAQVLGNIDKPPPLPTVEEVAHIKNTFICDGCGRVRDRQLERHVILCEHCLLMIQYIVSQLGEPEKSIELVYYAILEYLNKQKQQQLEERIKQQIQPSNIQSV